MNGQHLRQPGPAGCLYYAAHALTGAADLLDYAPADDWGAFVGHMARHGYVLLPLFVAVSTQRPATTPDWLLLVQQHEATQPGQPLDLMVHYLPHQRGDLHAVALRYTPADPKRGAMRGAVLVSDSARPHPSSFTLSHFLRTSYATCAVRIMQVQALGQA